MTKREKGKKTQKLGDNDTVTPIGVRAAVYGGKDNRF